jgi:hypothetical protein
VCPGTTNGFATCSAGTCGLACNSGYSMCGGRCLNTSSDPNNCGGCGIVCPVTGWGAVPTCSAGYCGYDCGLYIDCFNGSCVPPGYSCP